MYNMLDIRNALSAQVEVAPVQKTSGLMRKARMELQEEPYNAATSMLDHIQKYQDSVSIEEGIDTRAMSEESLTPPENEPRPRLRFDLPNMSDKRLLAITLEAEAASEGLEGMLAAGAVINNRVGTDRFGQTLRDVILAPGQFSAWNKETGYAGGEGGLNMRSIEPSEEALKAADMLIRGEYEDITGGATHYYNPEVADPVWGGEPSQGWLDIGRHRFGKA